MMRSGLAFKIVLLLIFMISISLFLSGSYSYLTLAEDVEQRLGQRLRDVAATAALTIPGELHQKVYNQYLELGKDAEKTKEFLELSKLLKTIKKVNNLESDVYTISMINRNESTELVFIGMSAEIPYLGNRMQLDPASVSTFERGKVNSTPLYENQNGQWISAFAPLKTKEGEVVGVLELDYSAHAEVKSAKTELFKSIGIPGVLSLIFSGLLGFIFGRNIAHPISELSKVVQKVAEGNLSIKVDYDQTTEVKTLSESLNSMTNDLRLQRDQIENYSRNLEEMVEMKTNQLRERDKMVFHSSKLAAIGQLAAGVAHEINNPLQIIYSNAELLKLELDREEHLTDSLDKRYNIIVDNVERIKVIVNGLRAYSRDEEESNKEFVPDNIISSCIEMISPIFKSKGVQITTDLDAFSHSINGDEGRFYQVIMNLLANAKDAIVLANIDQGCIVVKSRVESDSINISIIDNGPGIPDIIKDHIFEQFYTTKPVGEGTGLGLGLVQASMKKINGDISFTSKVGEGTTFTLKIPAFVSEKNEAIPSVEIVQSFIEENNPKNKYNVLLVDDETEIREIAKAFFQELGCNIVEACNGNEAIQILEENQHQFDLLLTDMQMPGPNGSKVAAKAKSLYPNLPVFLISGEIGLTEEKNKSFQDNIDGFIQKPFSLQELTSVVESLHKIDKAA